MGYASATTDLPNVANAAMFGSLTAAQQQAACDAASAEFDTCGRARYQYPIQQPYDPALVRDVCIVATYDLICLRGFNPQNGSDSNFEKRAIQVRKKWNEVKTQCSHYNIVEATNAPANAQPMIPAPLVVSQPLQGWNPNQPDPGSNNSGVY